MLEFFYWEPCLAEPGGHCTLNIDGKMISFWPLVSISKESIPVPSEIIEDVDLEYFVAGLRKEAVSHFQANKAALPSGVLVYRFLFNALKNKQSFSLLKTEITNVLDHYSKYLGAQLEAVKIASVMLVDWLEGEYSRNTQLLDFLKSKGEPSKRVDLSLLNLPALQQRLVALQNTNLTWYAKVGAKTDQVFNQQGLTQVAKFFPEMTGAQRFEPTKVRHNCASFIYDLLLAGGISNHSIGFSESAHIATALQLSIRYSAGARGETPSADDINKAGKVSGLGGPLRFMGYGTIPITESFGTTPYVLHQLCEHSSQSSQQTATSSQQQCVVM